MKSNILSNSIATLNSRGIFFVQDLILPVKLTFPIHTFFFFFLLIYNKIEDDI